MSDELTHIEAAERSAGPIHDLAANFMLDAQTYIDAASAGYEGMAFYFAGRGGVLGDVPHAEVTEAFVFFPPESVQAGWEASADVESRAEAAQRFATSAHRWAGEHMATEGIDYDRLSELAGRVIDAADGSDAAVFDGWRSLPEPDGDRELALHRINALRELRHARHGAAVADAGIAPVDAFMVKTPYMAAVFGWPEPDSPPDDEMRAAWEAAEAATNERFGVDLAVLDADELAEFCELVAQAHTAAG
ncbi:MAG: helix-turn-helix domain-containing protein [Microthrixaceae bacterium]